MSDWRRIAAEKPPEWFGDLDDDCTAYWAGFILRAEWMDDGAWWWAIYDAETKAELMSSNNVETGVYPSGEAARAAATEEARKFIR